MVECTTVLVRFGILDVEPTVIERKRPVQILQFIPCKYGTQVVNLRDAKKALKCKHVVPERVRFQFRRELLCRHEHVFVRALGAKRAAKRREASGGGGCFAEGDYLPPPPPPSAASARYDFVDSVDSDMDGRCGSNADGSCTYDYERAAEYSAFLRTVHPAFFAGAA